MDIKIKNVLGVQEERARAGRQSDRAGRGRESVCKCEDGHEVFLGIDASRDRFIDTFQP